MFNKKVGVILTIALCAAAMTGCGKEAATSEAPKTATTEAVTEVTTEEAKQLKRKPRQQLRPQLLHL